MQLNIGENIKHLRKSRDITQEEMAARLGVSFQAVSKWERGDTYPDITMLPALANFFGVSTDELIGMDDIKKREEEYNIGKIVNDFQRSGKFEEAVQFLRERLEVYPGNKRLLSDLAITMVMANYDASQAQPIYHEAIKNYENYLDIGRNEKFYSYVRATLCFMYYNVGEYEKTDKMMKTLPHIWESREVLSIEMTDGDEYVKNLKRMVRLMIFMISDKIDNIGNREHMASYHIRKLVLGWSMEGKLDGKLEKIAAFMEM